VNWIQCLSKAINYIEEHITEDISVDEISNQAYTSSSHFQLVFHVVMGMTIGEYIRNRRLSLAAQDLLKPNSRIIDVAMRYQYDTQESFSKAFTRFHGIPPSKVQRGNIRLFHPLTIHITIQGGFDMSHKLIDEFLHLDFSNLEDKRDERLSAEAYKRLISWAGQAREKNPGVFDALTEWILDDSNWSDSSLEENEWILMQGVLARFKEQNAKLRAFLKELEPSGVVNGAVFKALDRFDEELSGNIHDVEIREAVAKVFADFSVMKDPGIRKLIAGNKTGPTGTDTVDLFGYINLLKDCDAGVQWALFMPEIVKQQQAGFKVEHFEYREMPAMRFIGFEGEEYKDIKRRLEMMSVLNSMEEYKSGFDYDLFFMHHYGLGVDIGPWHGVWGRFMKADTPVPEGFLSFDFMTYEDKVVGPPYYSQFAFATFSGDMHAMHSREGFDCDAMYDVTRNIILGEGVIIPYPGKYWTAEVFLNGCDQWSTGYLFSVDRNV
jgi:AraC-like DNA-binding protein